LETECLLKYKLTAAGKTQQESTMLLNHKSAIDFIIDHPDSLILMKLSAIEDIHGILVKDLGIFHETQDSLVFFSIRSGG
jgi:Fic family protein